ncbi:polysaccharide deacetylase family protein [Devosia sp. 2618]|uniref:polysaccharide deacetylase family protein n=1 Tax=Devosia sp. 2618 TaxID=3156454 RepID=UPI0033955F64
MRELIASVDRFAGRVTNRLIERLPGPQINIPNTTPIVSFTFDDVPDTSLTAGAAILERYGALGTFYISGGLIDRREPDRTLISAEGCVELVRRGHELACHTFSHPNVRHLNSVSLAHEIATNRAFLKSVTGGREPTNFAYPYTAGSFRARRLMADTFRTARGGLEGINRGLTDRTYLDSMSIQMPDDRVLGLRQVVDDLVVNPGWLILYTHDVSNTPTDYGCTPDAFEALVRHTREAGCTILTVDAALDHFEAQA